MAAEIVAEETITVGQPIVVEGQASSTHYGAVFEDDGDSRLASSAAPAVDRAPAPRFTQRPC